MAGTNTPIFPQVIGTSCITIVNANGTSIQSFIAAANAGRGNGCKVESISITSTDTSNAVLNVYYYQMGNSYQIGTVAVPAGAGTDAAVTSAVSLLENNAMMPFIRRDSDGRPYIYIADAWELRVSVQTTVTSGKQLALVGTIGYY